MSDRIQRVETVYEGWLTLRLVDIRLAGEVVRRSIVDHPHGALVLLYNPTRRIARLIAEVRPPVEFVGEPPMLEVVGGKVDDGDPIGCAHREAIEEAGIRVRQLERVACLWQTPASSTERVHYFLGAFEDEDRVGRGGGLAEENEAVAVHDIALAALWAMAERGEIRDGRLFLLLQALRLRRPELFVSDG